MAHVLGVDSSTQSTKVEVRDLDSGRLVAAGASPHPPTSPPCSEQHPASWWDALTNAVAQAGRPDVVALSIAGQQHGMVVLDDAGEVLRPAKLWNDTESAPDADDLVARAGSQWWADTVGSVPVASFTITKLAWLRRTQPTVFTRVRAVLLPHDWLTLQLTGRRVTDRGDASGTGYWSPSDEGWCAEPLRMVDDGVSAEDWLDRLPEILPPDQALEPDGGRGLEALGLRGRPKVAPGTGDNMAAALGIGLGPGQVAISIGTSGTVYSVSSTSVRDPRGLVAGFADAAGRYLPLACTLNAGKVIDTVAGLLGVGVAELGEMALREDALDGPVMVPYFDGERTPNRPGASGVLAGLRTTSTRGEVAAAAHRGVICSLLDGLDALRDSGVDLGDDPIRLVSGGARSGAHQQLLADLSGRPVLVSDGDEHVATGAAVQAAAVATGTSPDDVAAAWGLGHGLIVEPRACDADAIRERYDALRRASEALDRD